MVLAQVVNDHLAAPIEQFVFAHGEDEPTSVAHGASVETLTFKLHSASKPSWTWDADEKRWLRSEGQSPHFDHDENPLAAVNVVSITAPHVASGFKAQNNTVVPTYELTGEGAAAVATGGNRSEERRVGKE